MMCYAAIDLGKRKSRAAGPGIGSANGEVDIRGNTVTPVFQPPVSSPGLKFLRSRCRVSTMNLARARTVSRGTTTSV